MYVCLCMCCMCLCVCVCMRMHTLCCLEEWLWLVDQALCCVDKEGDLSLTGYLQAHPLFKTTVCSNIVVLWSWSWVITYSNISQHIPWQHTNSHTTCFRPLLSTMSPQGIYRVTHDTSGHYRGTWYGNYLIIPYHDIYSCDMVWIFRLPESTCFQAGTNGT